MMCAVSGFTDTIQWISLCIFLFSLLCAFVVAVKKLDIVKPLLILGIGVSVAGSVLLLEFGYRKITEIDGKTEAVVEKRGEEGPVNDRASAVSTAIMTMTQMVTLNAEYGDIIKYANTTTNLFLILVVIFSVLLPIVWGSVLLTLFESFASWLMYQVFSCFVPVYFFSDLHERSLELAESILVKNNKRCLCVFCKVSEDAPSELKEEAKSYRCLLFKKSEIHYIKNPKRTQTFFEISENQDDNLVASLALIKRYIKKYDDADYSSVKIFLYSDACFTKKELLTGQAGTVATSCNHNQPR